MTEKIAGKRVYVVDDHPLMRDSLVSLLDAQPDIAVCGAAGSASLAMQEMMALRPQLAIIDLSLADSSGLELIKTIRAKHPKLLIIVYSMHDENLYAERCIRSGAQGYVMKSRPAKQVIDAMRDVLSGKISVSEQLLEMFFERSLGKTRQEYGQITSKLSDRELEIFDLLGRGSGTRQIAQNLNLSIKTVQTYAARIKQKLCLSTGTELMREATLWYDKTL